MRKKRRLGGDGDGRRVLVARLEGGVTVATTHLHHDAQVNSEQRERLALALARVEEGDALFVTGDLNAHVDRVCRLRNWVHEATFIKPMNGSRSIDAVASSEEPLFVRAQGVAPEARYRCRDEAPRVLLWSGFKRFRRSLEEAQRCCRAGRCRNCLDGVPRRLFEGRSDLGWFGAPWTFEPLLSDHGWVLCAYESLTVLTYNVLQASAYLKSMFVNGEWLMSASRFHKQADVLLQLDVDVITLQEVGACALKVYSERFSHRYRAYSRHPGSRSDGLMIISKRPILALHEDAV